MALVGLFPNLDHENDLAKRFAKWLEPLQNSRIPE